MTYFTLADHPLVRKNLRCPFCKGFKNTGLVACWDCYHREGLKYGRPEAETRLDERERELAKGAA